MMIRSTNIPIILNQICDDTSNNIVSALLVTPDGELLGSSGGGAFTSNRLQQQQQQQQLPTPESLGTLLADIAWDYYRLGEEFSTLYHPEASSSSPISKMECLFLEMDFGIVGISTCRSSNSNNNNNNTNGGNTGDVGCFVIVIATPDAPLGLIQMRLQTVTTHVQESLLSSTVLTTIHNNTMTVT